MQKPQKLILKSFLSPGDIVMLTAAVRDLHRCYPNRFVTDVRTPCPALWEHNPYLTPLEESDPEARVVECHYPLVHESNQKPYHFIHGFIEYLNEQLDLRIKPTEFKGDIHLSEEEKSRPSQVAEALGEDRPFWIIVAGGKYDYTIKWWSRKRYQEVVDHFRDKILFVQVGEKGHYHPPLRNVHDLRKKTSLRDLVRLVYHADGVLCPVTLLMHLAAAVPVRPEKRVARACVVIAGGREPSHWEAYPIHQFLHTVGSLSCCAQGGCWRSRTTPLGDGECHDEPERLCLHVMDGLPRCMQM
ncbi:MAG TPA: glycosyltransferase family 9 protein, partial [Verrucomicrobiae bacterium]|nr:glycosyltransferase family 9 protein [Verrucomicrobiae bacterium]